LPAYHGQLLLVFDTATSSTSGRLLLFLANITMRKSTCLSLISFFSQIGLDPGFEFVQDVWLPVTLQLAFLLEP
jgi:hypothetical protein